MNRLARLDGFNEALQLGIKPKRFLICVKGFPVL